MRCSDSHRDRETRRKATVFYARQQELNEARSTAVTGRAALHYGRGSCIQSPRATAEPQMSSPWAGKHSPPLVADTPTVRIRAKTTKARNGQLRRRRRPTIVAGDKLMFRRVAAAKNSSQRPPAEHATFKRFCRTLIASISPANSRLCRQKYDLWGLPVCKRDIALYTIEPK